MSECNFSDCIAAYKVFKMSKDRHFSNPDRAIESAVEWVKEKIGQNDKLIKLKLKLYKKTNHKSKDAAHRFNIFRNLCQRKDLQDIFDSLFGEVVQDPHPLSLVNFETLPQLTLEHPATECNVCGKTLKRKLQKNGTTAVVYQNVKGPTLAIHYTKECTRCNRKWEYGQIHQIRGTELIPLSELEYFQSSPSTFFNPDVFDEAGVLSMDCQTGMEKCAFVFNQRFEKQIQEIDDHLKKIQQQNTSQTKKSGNTLGKRDSAKLHRNRLSEAFYLYNLRSIIENELHHTHLTIKKEDVKKMNEKYEERITAHRNSQSQKQKKTRTDGKIRNAKNMGPNEIFHYLYQKYKEQIANCSLTIFEKVPVHKKKGHVYPGHFSVMIDGNVKSSRIVCAYPENCKLQGVFKI